MRKNLEKVAPIQIQVRGKIIFRKFLMYQILRVLVVGVETIQIMKRHIKEISIIKFNLSIRGDHLGEHVREKEDPLDEANAEVPDRD